MTLTGLLGVLSALAFVLGLFFLALRLLRHLPALGRSGAEGPELRVLGRAGLTPKQGVATVRVGGRTLVVGYGEGGVRYLADVEAHEAVPAMDTPAGPESDSPLKAIPFRAALAKAVRRASLFALVVTGMGLTAASAAPLSATVPASLAAAVPQQEEAVRTPQVQGPRSPDGVRVPGVDFPSLDVRMGDGDGDDLRLQGPVGTVLFIGFLTLLPTLLLLMTSFTRILVVLHLLKQAIGTQTAPPAHLLAAMALLLTGFVMAPTLSEANETGIRPWMAGEIDEVQMLDSASVPFREFMLSTVRDSDLRTFVEMQEGPLPETVDDIPLVVVTSAFVTSELRAAFQMGFALFLPFVIIDIVVASVLMSMGMFMLPPVMVSLPFKLLLFVMVDGWALVVGSLVRSFG